MKTKIETGLDIGDKVFVLIDNRIVETVIKGVLCNTYFDKSSVHTYVKYELNYKVNSYKNEIISVTLDEYQVHKTVKDLLKRMGNNIKELDL